MLRDLIIDDDTWDAASDQRIIEWESLIREFVDPGNIIADERLDVVELDYTDEMSRLRGLDAAGETIAEVDIPHGDLTDILHEYIDIVRQIGACHEEGLGVARLEALDMAKKVTHDKAGRKLKRLCRPFGFDHSTTRRLFTILLSLRVDTTRLHGVHGHRKIR